MNDFRYAVRLLQKRPGFAVVTVLSLAFGLAVNTAVFTFVNAMNLRPVPGVKAPEGIVFPDRPYWYFSHPEFEHIRAHASVFSHIVATSRAQTIIRREPAVNLAPEETGQPGVVLLVSGDYFEALGAAPPRGRYFYESDFRTTEATSVAVISDECWKQKLQSDPSVIGQTIRLNGAAFTVIGVAPEEFRGAEPFHARGVDVWLPLTAQPLLHPGKSFLGDPTQKRVRFFARLRPGASLRQATAEMAVLENQLAAATAEKVATDSSRPKQRWSDELAAGYRFRLLRGEEFRLAMLVQVIAIIVLLVACANGANLLLAQAAIRTRELGIRIAIGAGRWRLVRQSLAESVLLGMLAGGVGLLLSMWSCDLIRGMLLGDVNQFSQNETPLLDLRPDFRILLFALGLSAIAGLAVGLLPALRASRSDPCTALKGEMPGELLGTRPAFWRNGLIVAQFVASLVLLVAAGLLVRIAWQGIHRDYRIDLNTVQLVQVDFWSKGFNDSRIVREKFNIVEQAPLMPGIKAAALISQLEPRDYHSPPSLFTDDGHEPIDVPGLAPYPVEVTPGFFDTMGMTVVHGRGFAADERAVAIVSEPLARTLWPGRNAIGRRLKVGENGTYAEVVGVIASAFDRSVFEQAPAPARYLIAGFGSDLFLPSSRGSSANDARAHLVVRHDGRPAISASAMAVLGQSVVEQDVAVYTRPLREVFEYWMKPFVLFARLGVVLGGLALVLATIGLHGVISYVVSQRTTEFGVRMAMGASRGQVMRLVLRQSAVLVGWATSIGLLLSLGAAIAMRAGIYGVLVWDPAVFIGPAAVLALVALAASLPPALRAANVDPIRALRHQ